MSIPVLIKWESPPPLRRGISYYKEGDEYGELPLMYTSTLTWKPSCHSQFVSVETVMLWCRSNSQFVFKGGVYSLRSRHMSDHLFMSLGTFHWNKQYFRSSGSFSPSSIALVREKVIFLPSNSSNNQNNFSEKHCRPHPWMGRYVNVARYAAWTTFHDLTKDRKGDVLIVLKQRDVFTMYFNYRDFL